VILERSQIESNVCFFLEWVRAYDRSGCTYIHHSSSVRKSTVNCLLLLSAVVPLSGERNAYYYSVR
jgi:hypothetical protein